MIFRFSLNSNFSYASEVFFPLVALKHNLTRSTIQTDIQNSGIIIFKFNIPDNLALSDMWYFHFLRTKLGRCKKMSNHIEAYRRIDAVSSPGWRTQINREAVMMHLDPVPCSPPPCYHNKKVSYWKAILGGGNKSSQMCYIFKN